MSMRANHASSGTGAFDPAAVDNEEAPQESSDGGDDEVQVDKMKSEEPTEVDTNDDDDEDFGDFGDFEGVENEQALKQSSVEDDQTQVDNTKIEEPTEVNTNDDDEYLYLAN